MDTMLLREIGLNEDQVATLTRAGDATTTSGVEVILERYRTNTASKNDTYNGLLGLVMTVNHEKQIRAHQERIAEGGFSIQGVHANPSFAYSIGLSHTLGFEIIAKGKISVGILGSLINITAKYLLEGGTLEGPFSTDDFKVNDAELRMKLVDCEDVSYILNQYANATCNPDYMEVPPSAFKQLFVGDERNRLPGERGYNRTMGQQLKDLKDGPSDQDTLH